MHITLTQSEAQKFLNEKFREDFNTEVSARIVAENYELDFLSCIKNKEKLQAIKLIREATGTGLVEAKGFCEVVFDLFGKLPVK